MKQWIRIVIGTSIFIVIYTILQHGPLLLGQMASYPIKFFSDSSRKYSADISELSKGKYYLSIGRSLGEVEIRLNNAILQKAQLIAGVTIDISDEFRPKILTIECTAKEQWRERLFNAPVITGYSVGLLIQEWRIFNGVFMGPVSSLLLILMALVNLRLSKNSSSDIWPHFIFGVSGFIYTFYLSGIPDLFFDPTENTLIQIELRAFFSAALILLIGTYSRRKNAAILIIHLICALLVPVIGINARSRLTDLYEIELVIFGFSTLVALVPLFKIKKITSEIELMIFFCLSFSVVHFFAVTMHYFYSVSNWTVWSPSVIATLAGTNFYFIYKKAVSRSAENLLSSQQYFMAAQIAHDIRSPLASLNAVIHNSNNLDDLTRAQIGSVVSRIRGIANNLLSQKDSHKLLGIESRMKALEDSKIRSFCVSSESSSVEIVVPILDSLVFEKRLQFSNQRKISIYLNDALSEFKYFSNIQRVEFGRVISNLINNAAEAMSDGGQVLIDLKEVDSRIQIVIKDNGRGMSLDVLSKIGKLGYSSREGSSESGNGLGVHHAMETIKTWGGELRYESEFGKGTRAIISLPKADAPDWFIDEIKLNLPATVIVLDDDPTMHPIWERRFSLSGQDGIHFHYFSTSKEMIQWYRETLGAVDHPIYLCDYELIGSDHTGLDVIEMLGVGKDAILITNRWDDFDLRARCVKSGIKIFPKTLEIKVLVQERINDLT